MDSARVLIVDDVESVADTYALQLGEDYDVEVAYSGETALEAVDEDLDVVLLDRRMPEYSGEEVLLEIRDRGYAPMVALVTAVDPTPEAAAMPFDDYLIKPFTAEELRTTVERLVEIAGADERVRELLAKRRRRTFLEANLPLEDLEYTAAYRELREAIESLETDLEAEGVDVGGPEVGR